MEYIFSIILQVLTLVGVASLIAVGINILKATGKVKDGQAGAWSGSLNLIALITLVGLKIYRPDLDIKALDIQLGVIAQILGFVLSWLLQIKSSFTAHGILSETHMPLGMGKSFSADKLAEISHA